MRNKLKEAYYQQEDVVALSKDLLGKYLVTNLGGQGITSGKIVETEAYNGITDRASHAYGQRLTARTKVMYQQGGVAYVYLIYGIYHLFNIITGDEGVPTAILIRAIEPAEGMEVMLNRRQMPNLLPKLTAGPGVLSIAMGIDKSHTGTSLTGDEIWVEDRGLYIPGQDIISSPRVGVGYAREDALLPWRFRVAGSRYTSPAK